MKKIFALLLVLALSISLFGCGCIISNKDHQDNSTPVNDSEISENDDSANEAKYDTALALIKSGECQEAYEILKALGDYKDAKELLTKFVPMVLYYKYSQGEMQGDEFVPEYTNENVAIIGANGFPIEVSYTESDGETYNSKVTYDESGRPISVLSYGADEFYENTTLTYDAQGNATGYVTKDKAGNVTFSFTLTYDANGNKTEQVRVYESGYTEIEKFEYDSENRNVRHERIWGADNADNAEIYEYFYNAEGLLIKETCSYMSGGQRQLLCYEYEYDSEGKLLTADILQNGVKSNAIYYYDNNDNLTKCVEEDEFGKVNTISYFYDENGNVIKGTYVVIDEDGDLVLDNTTEYTYNDRGLVENKSHVSINYLTPDYSMEIRHEYEYDEYGNIIKEAYSDSYGSASVEEYRFSLVFITDAITDIIIEQLSELVLYT